MYNFKETKEKVSYNYDYQIVFLRMMVTDFELFVRCQNILKPDFFDKSLQHVVKFLLEYADQYKGVPSTEVIKSKTNFTIEKLAEIIESEKNWFLNEIEKFCRHKSIELAILKSADLLESGYYNDVEGLVREAVLVSLNRELGTDYFENPRERLERLLKQNGSISTGWKSFDNVIYKLGRGELAIFTAIAGGGKSVALQNLTLNWAMQNYNVVYFTLELSEELVSKRLDAMITGIPNASIFRQIDKVELQVKMKEKHMGAIQIKYVKPGTTTNDIRAYLKEYQIKNSRKPDMIIIDYLDLMHANSSRVDAANFFAKDKLVSEELRGLAMEEGLVLATASQLNRSGYDELNPTAANIAGGISKVNTADLVVNVNQTVPARERGEITFMLMKTRNSGGVGKHIVFKFDVDTLRIVDMDENEAKVRELRSSAEELIESSPVFDNTDASKGLEREIYTITETGVGTHTVKSDDESKKLTPALTRLLNTTKKD